MYALTGEATEPIQRCIGIKFAPSSPLKLWRGQMTGLCSDVVARQGHPAGRSASASRNARSSAIDITTTKVVNAVSAIQ